MTKCLQRSGGLLVSWFIFKSVCISNNFQTSLHFTVMVTHSGYDNFILPGGCAVVTCPCAVVYGVKLNLRAESPRDCADLLLSMKHFPNVTLYDFARGLATHTYKHKRAIVLALKPSWGETAGSYWWQHQIGLCKESESQLALANYKEASTWWKWPPYYRVIRALCSLWPLSWGTPKTQRMFCAR